MTKTERAIEHFEGMVRLAQNRHPHPELEFWQAALDALRLQQKAEKCEPLTLEELRKMDGEPVWVAVSENWKKSGCREGWCLVGFHKSNERIAAYIYSPYRGMFHFPQQDYGTSWWAYRRPPKEG